MELNENILNTTISGIIGSDGDDGGNAEIVDFRQLERLVRKWSREKIGTDPDGVRLYETDRSELLSVRFNIGQYPMNASVEYYMENGRVSFSAIINTLKKYYLNPDGRIIGKLKGRLDGWSNPYSEENHMTVVKTVHDGDLTPALTGIGNVLHDIFTGGLLDGFGKIKDFDDGD